MALYAHLFHSAIPGQRDELFYLQHNRADFESIWDFPGNRRHILSAWRGHYEVIGLPVENDLIDVIIYHQAEAPARPAYNAHMNGPSVWELVPQYEKADDLPAPICTPWSWASSAPRCKTSCPSMSPPGTC